MPEPQDAKLRRPPRPPVRREPTDGPSPAYAELAVTTNYSFLRGGSHPDELVFRAAEQGHAAVGIADLNSVAGVVRAFDACRMVREQSGGEVAVKLVVGARLRFVDAPDVLVWPTDRAGYGRLCRMLTTGKRRTGKGGCLLSLSDLFDHHEGLQAAVVPSGNALADATRVLRPLREAMGDRLSIAACRSYEQDARRTRELLDLSWAAGNVPLLAINDVHYHARGRRPLQDVLTCVRHGCTVRDAGRKLFPNGERYLKSPTQMARLFADLPRAIRRSVEVAERCGFSLDELRYEYPVNEVVPPNTTPILHLSDLAYAGAEARYPGGVPEKVRAAVEHELNLIAELQIAPYFLTVEDLVRFARSREILCQGRGSAANSAVCYCLGVTAVDPARSELLFERFVSSARNEPPDIDVDFEHERREEVIQYVYAKYGRDRAAMTAEVISYRPRSAVRDVGKAMGLGLDVVDRLAKRLDAWGSRPPSEQDLREIGLDPSDRTVRQVFHLTGQLLGFPRHLSQHVGGMVVTRGPLADLVPVENASMPGRTVIEWDKDDVDVLGILKVDLLALGMLTCLRKTLDLANATRPESMPLKLETIPPECPATYDMIGHADTVGVFQIESRAQMTMLPRLRPRTFYDLVVEVAIVRPGPIQGGMVHPYLRRRMNQEPVTYPSEQLRQVLGRTLGVPLFQEQVMAVAMVAAGFTAAKADQLRRAMAAWKKKGGLEPFRDKLVAGMLANGYEADFAERCFEQIKGFGEYGFPESHAASFALLAYASSWLKRHHPAAFCCGLLNSQPMGFYAPAQLVRDAREHGVEVRPVDVNHSDWDCTLEPPTSFDVPDDRPSTWGRGGPAVRLGLRRVKGLRRADADRLVAARQEVGRFASVEHLHRTSGLPTHAIERLAAADAFGSLPRSRRSALWRTLSLDDGQYPLFDLTPTEGPEDDAGLPAMPLGGEVMADYATVGLSLKQHPLALVRDALAREGVRPCSGLADLRQGTAVRVAGLVLIRQQPGTAMGTVFVTLEDETGTANLILRPGVYDRHRRAARGSTLLRADGRVERQGEVVHVVADRLHDRGDLLAGLDLRSRDFH